MRLMDDDGITYWHLSTLVKCQVYFDIPSSCVTQLNQTLNNFTFFCGLHAYNYSTASQKTQSLINILENSWNLIWPLGNMHMYGWSCGDTIFFSLITNTSKKSFLRLTWKAIVKLTTKLNKGKLPLNMCKCNESAKLDHYHTVCMYIFIYRHLISLNIISYYIEPLSIKCTIYRANPINFLVID